MKLPTRKIVITVLILIVILYYIWLSSVPVSMDKYDTLMKIPTKFRPNTILYTTDLDLNTLRYPQILKPVDCSGHGNLVKIAHSKEEVKEYNNFNGIKFMLQDYTQHKYEIGLLYERYPFNKKGTIINIHEKVYKCNENCTQEYKIYTPDNVAIKSEVFVKKNKYITPTITNIIDIITKNISPKIYACHYDIVFNNYNDFANGDFKIIEINGVVANDLDIWHTTFKSKTEIRTKWLIRRLIMGFYNAITLNGLSIPNFIKHISKGIKYSIKCDNIYQMLRY